EGLAELMIPLPERQRLALVAVEWRARFQERDHCGAVGGAAPHDCLAEELERGPGGPRRVAERGTEPTPEAPVQLAGAEALQLVVPPDRPQSHPRLNTNTHPRIPPPAHPT